MDISHMIEDTRQIRCEIHVATCLKAAAALEGMTVAQLATNILCDWLSAEYPDLCEQTGCDKACTDPTLER